MPLSLALYSYTRTQKVLMPQQHRPALEDRIETFLKVSVGLTSMIWAFFLFREPRRGAYHQVEELKLPLSCIFL